MAIAEKVAIITGASSGIGKDVALGLAQDSYALGLIARSKDRLEELAKQIENEYSPKTKPLVLVADVCDVEAVNSAVSKVVNEWGRIDLLFNSAGIHVEGNWNVDPDAFKEQIDVNVQGTFHAVRAVVPKMKEQGSGYIINVASRRGRVTTPAEGAYSVSKHAVVGFNEALYKELCPSGIKVTALCPGWVLTSMSDNAPVAPEEMIQTSDIMEILRFLLKLSPAACIKEVFLEPRGDLS